ncbi:hypothetical protein KFL_000650120 [Klebsormidium nitens]|uniref:Meiosis-specific protein ASY3-like coiled-coil domain-containing protein n=1 Tax=Klebsormidium nitens TaxID=105231 RepID=A0A1Y1HUM5_KLENI|nr:hypothetical protein KFL_000650120 [Klebsormidium nitens]|eukprot:GAQ80879.1 hypothetical protein KFL_000650120 [Klebsormidium nitens]
MESSGEDVETGGYEDVVELIAAAEADEELPRASRDLVKKVHIVLEGAVLRKRSIDASLAKRVLKVIRALLPSSLREVLEEETVEKLGDIFDALFRPEKQTGTTFAVLGDVLYTVEDLCDTKEGREKCGPCFIPRLVRLQYGRLPFKVRRAAIESLSAITEGSAANLKELLKLEKDCTILFTQTLPSCGDFLTQASILEILYRIVRKQSSLLQTGFCGVEKWRKSLKEEFLMIAKKRDPELYKEIRAFLLSYNASLGAARSVFSVEFERIVIDGNEATAVTDRWLDFGSNHVSFYALNEEDKRLEADEEGAALVDLPYGRILDLKRSSATTLSLVAKSAAAGLASAQFSQNAQSTKEVSIEMKDKEMVTVERVILPWLNSKNKQDLPQELVKGPLHLVSTRTPERADNNKENLPPNNNNALSSPRKEGGKMTTRLDPELHNWEDVFRQPQGPEDHRETHCTAFQETRNDRKELTHQEHSCGDRSDMPIEMLRQQVRGLQEKDKCRPAAEDADGRGKKGGAKRRGEGGEKADEANKELSERDKSSADDDDSTRAVNIGKDAGVAIKSHRALRIPPKQNKVESSSPEGGKKPEKEADTGSPHNIGAKGGGKDVAAREMQAAKVPKESVNQKYIAKGKSEGRKVDRTKENNHGAFEFKADEGKDKIEAEKEGRLPSKKQGGPAKRGANEKEAVRNDGNANGQPDDEEKDQEDKDKKLDGAVNQKSVAVRALQRRQSRTNQPDSEGDAFDILPKAAACDPEKGDSPRTPLRGVQQRSESPAPQLRRDSMYQDEQQQVEEALAYLLEEEDPDQTKGNSTWKSGDDTTAGAPEAKLDLNPARRKPLKLKTGKRQDESEDKKPANLELSAWNEDLPDAGFDALEDPPLSPALTPEEEAPLRLLADLPKSERHLRNARRNGVGTEVKSAKPSEKEKPARKSAPAPIDTLLLETAAVEEELLGTPDEGLLDTEGGTDEGGLGGAVKMIAKMVTQLKGKMKLQSKRKASSIVEDAKEAMQAEMLKVQKKVKKDSDECIRVCKRKFGTIEAQLQAHSKKMKMLHDKFQADFKQQLDEYENTFAHMDDAKVDMKEAIDKTKAAHKKLFEQAQESATEILQQTEKKLQSINKGAREMKALRQALVGITAL